jgi:hypothetical protein
MFVYWRIQQDLTCMGETICFKDPAFVNQVTKWTKKNIGGLKMVEDVSSGKNINKIETGGRYDEI